MFKRGELNAEQLPSGTIIVKEINESLRDEYNVIYCRVSSSQNKNNLDYQAERLINFCNAKGWRIHEIVKEIGSGLNDNRPKLLQILSKNKTTRIIIEHKDRLTRFGFNYIKTLYHGEIYVLMRLNLINTI